MWKSMAGVFRGKMLTWKWTISFQLLFSVIYQATCSPVSGLSSCGCDSRHPLKSALKPENKCTDGFFVSYNYCTVYIVVLKLVLAPWVLH